MARERHGTRSDALVQRVEADEREVRIAGAKTNATRGAAPDAAASEQSCNSKQENVWTD